MKIYTRIVLDQDSNVLEQDSYKYDGPIAECGGGGSRGTQTTKTVESKDPWGSQQPYLERGFKESLGQFEGAKPEYFPGSTVVPLDPLEKTALSMRAEQAVDPASLPGQAKEQVRKTMAGEYLGADSPMQQEILKTVTGAVRPGVDSSFARAGRFGSPLHAGAMAEGVTKGMLPFYESERQRQATSPAAAMQMAGYTPSTLGQVGRAYRADEERSLQEDINRYNFEQMQEQDKLRNYINNITGNFGGVAQRTATEPLYSDPLSTGLGYAATAASIGSELAGPGTAMGGTMFPKTK
jgi:hypothetical protein